MAGAVALLFGSGTDAQLKAIHRHFLGDFDFLLFHLFPAHE